jgi:hypothetical protein
MGITSFNTHPYRVKKIDTLLGLSMVKFLIAVQEKSAPSSPLLEGKKTSRRPMWVSGKRKSFHLNHARNCECRREM